MNEQLERQFWRIRMRYTPQKGENDYSKTAWKLRQAGIWYGAWSASDFCQAMKENPNNPHDYLNRVPDQKSLIEKLGKKGAVGPSEIHTIKRFYGSSARDGLDGISENEWVVACFDEKIHLARVVGKPESDLNNEELNRPHPEAGTRELWKFRKLADPMEFRLAALPDLYMLIPQAGQSNVYRLRAYRQALQILLECKTEEGVRDRFEAMSNEERLQLLGPGSWESFCLGYLILEEQFLPTGLAVGRTLEGFDIVGRSSKTGRQILAQCKKDDDSKDIAESFLRKIEKYGTNVTPYYFAYHGCNNAPSNPKVIMITRENVLLWAQIEPGKSYLNNFFLK